MVEKSVSRLKKKWRSKPIKSKINRDLDSAKMHLRSKFGDSSLNGWRVMGRTSSKWGKIWLSSLIWPWRSRLIMPKNNRHLNKGLLHLCFKIGDSSLNEWWVIVRTSPWLTHTHTDTRTYGHTDAGNDNILRPKLASGNNETTIPNTESALQSAASNDDENEIEMLTMSSKRPIHEDSSEEHPASPLPAKKAATGSSAGGKSGTHVPKGRGGGDLPKSSAFPANAPQPRGRGSNQGDKSPAWTPRFSTNTGEGSGSSAQGGRNRGPLNRRPPLKPPGTIKTATKDKT